MNPFRHLLHPLVGPLVTEEIARGYRWTKSEYRLWRMHRRGVIRATELTMTTRSLRLHLGCGHIYKPGWVNVDSYSAPPCTPDLLLDLRRPLPFPNGSCTEVYSEHFFEHLPFPEGARALLSETARVLAPGGRTSIGVPDPQPVLTAYLTESADSYFDYFFQHPSVQRHLHTRMEAVNWLFRQGGEHHFIYDFPSLEKLLRATGFRRVQRREFDPSRDSEPRRLGTLYVDAWKD